MYRTTVDPWSFATSPYELHRYEALVEHVPRGRFARAFEPGCSIGELTVRLAERCGFVTAIDIAENAVETARRRCEHLHNVDEHQCALPDDLPASTFDLVVFSEIGYYFDEPQLAELATSISSLIEPGGQLLAAHWTGQSADHVLHGTRVHEILHETVPMEHLRHEQHRSADYSGFIVDVWSRTSDEG